MCFVDGVIMLQLKSGLFWKIQRNVFGPALLKAMLKSISQYLEQKIRPVFKELHKTMLCELTASIFKPCTTCQAGVNVI